MKAATQIVRNKYLKLKILPQENTDFHLNKNPSVCSVERNGG